MTTINDKKDQNQILAEKVDKLTIAIIMLCNYIRTLDINLEKEQEKTLDIIEKIITH